MSQNSVLEFVKLIKRLIPKSGKTLLIMLIITIIYEGIKFIPTYLLKLIIDGVFNQQPIKELFPYVIGIFIVLVIMLLVEIRSVIYVALVAANKSKEILNKLFKKFMELPLSWHEKQNTGALVSKSTKAANYLDSLLWFTRNSLMPGIIQIILTAIVLLFVDWRIGGLFVIFTPTYLYFIDKQFRQVQPFREKYHQAYDQSVHELAQSLYNIQTVKDYSQEKREEKKHNLLLEKYVEGIKDRTKFELKTIINRDILMHAMRTGTLALSLWLVYNGTLTPGDLVFVFTLNEKAFLNLYRLGRIYLYMGDMYESLSRADKIQNTKSELKDEGKKTSKNGDIVFESVNFDYGAEKIIKNANLVFKKGTTTALVGHSGGGKTTIVKLVMRHYDPTSGKITLAGTNLRDIKLNDLRGKIAFVNQNTEIFDRTIHENIAYGKPKATRKEVINAAKKANADSFIKHFTKGYDTVVGEKGIRLSGGQRQRISIARAVIAEAKIIVFDEATSSLDSESERLIQDAVLKIKGKTLIIIAHRLSTIEHADHIIVLKEGSIVEEGSHINLLSKKKGIYKKMIELQKLGKLRE